MSSEIVQNNRSSILLLFIMTILPISVSFVSLIFFSKYEETILNFTFLQWSIFYILTSITMSFALTPTTYIALISGYFIGWSGLVGLLPSYLLASLIGFFLAGNIDKGTFMNHLMGNEKINGIINQLKREEFWVIFFCRISPATPFAMMNVFLSFLKVKLKNFIFGSLLGMFPRTLLSVWIGTQAKNIVQMLKGKEQPEASNLLLIALFMVSAAGLYIIFMRAVKKYNKAAQHKKAV